MDQYDFFHIDYIFKQEQIAFKRISDCPRHDFYGHAEVRSLCTHINLGFNIQVDIHQRKTDIIFGWVD